MKSENLTYINVKYNKAPCYDIVIADDFSNFADEISKLDIKNKKLCIVTETNVGPLYAAQLKSIIEPMCKMVICFEFPAGEDSKNLDTINDLYSTLIENKFDRTDMLIALGGGVTGDMTGYAAATYLRGIDFVQVPTSLLSQVDSSIGGKTGVDYKSYKNMIGAFKQPKLVYISLSTLHSLPEREYISGMGEIIKHGLIKDAEYYEWLKDNSDLIKKRDLTTIKTMISRSCNIKREVVERDPEEKGERGLLNFGHTFGHAIEKLMDFRLLHGECVCIGMAASSYISYKKGYISEGDYNDILECIASFNLPVKFKDLNIDDIIDAMYNDKKMDSGVIKFILLSEIGNAVIDRTVTEDMMKSALAASQDL